jgi:hypothetical protein
MICPQCQESGLKSKVFVGGSSTTLMVTQTYYDEDGKFHHHDPNTTTTNYRCSEGHVWIDSERGKCWCES